MCHYAQQKFLNLMIFIYLYICIFMDTHLCVCLVCGGQRTICGVPRIELLRALNPLSHLAGPKHGHFTVFSLCPTHPSTQVKIKIVQH